MFSISVRRLMVKNPDEVRFIGIWGMGGVGKTTSARAIFEECKNTFDGSCFLQDVRQKKNKLVGLQAILLSTILKMELKFIVDTHVGSCMLQERLQFKRVVIVIDDVDDIEKLSALGGGYHWFGRGSRIVITTRDDHLLNNLHEKYIINSLPEHEAMKLFCRQAFKNDNPPEDFAELSQRVTNYASGLPLALVVLGAHLCQRKKRVWESTLNRLKYTPQDKIISKLEISFDGLNNIEQNIFLDVACFFRGMLEAEVIAVLHGSGFHPEEGISCLIQKSLIYINKDGMIEMHDLLQEMGWHIVRRNANNEIRKYSRLWLQDDVLEVLSQDKVIADAEGILFNDTNSDWSHLHKLRKVALNNMSKLRLLVIVDGLLGSEGAEDLPNGLMWLVWKYYPAQSLPECFQPVKLYCLAMSCSNIVTTPDFSHMPNLRKLDISFSEELVHVHASLGYHKKIQDINLNDCSKLEEFPRIIQMVSLETLNLSRTKLRELPDIEGNMDALTKLNLEDMHITSLPRSIERAINLQKMDITSCHNLLRLPSNIMGLPDLQLFSISSCNMLKCFTENLPPCLLSDKRGGELITSKSSQLSSLRFLYLIDCKSLEALPDLPSSIEILEISECPTLTRSITPINLLNKYKNLCYLDFDQELPLMPQFLQAFTDKCLMSNVLLKREKVLQVIFPGEEIPNWFDYQHSWPCTTVALSPLSQLTGENRLRGFAVSIITDCPDRSFICTSNGHNLLNHDYHSYLYRVKHTRVIYIPIDILKQCRRDRQWPDDSILFEVTSMNNILGWAFHLVFEVGVHMADRNQIHIIKDHFSTDSVEKGKLTVRINGDDEPTRRLRGRI